MPRDKIGFYTHAPIRDGVAFYLEFLAKIVHNMIAFMCFVSPNHSKAHTSMELDIYKNGLRFSTRRVYGNKAITLCPSFFMKAEDLRNALEILEERRKENES